MKKALITGINSQDGSYLAELLLEKGYEIHGTVRRSSLENAAKMENVAGIINKIAIHACSIEDPISIFKLIAKINPDECYHLAASSFVSYTFEDESSVIATNFNTTHNLLSSIKELVPNCRIYFAGTSEMFGDADCTPQNEQTRFNPRSIYGISKLASYHLVKRYREQYGLFACTGIAYNHESSRRNPSFVTRKISIGVAKIALGMIDSFELGNIEAVRDWGYSPDYVEAMWKMLQNERGAIDYVIATGITHTVSDVLEIAFASVGLRYENRVLINDAFFRPSESKTLCGDSSKIINELAWLPKKQFSEIIAEMVINDVRKLGGE